MKLSKKAAKELGIVLAHSLHKCTSLEAREAVLDVRCDITGKLEVWEQYLAFKDSFNETMDILEPLTIAGPRA